jgi:hypothetical protein
MSPWARQRRPERSTIAWGGFFGRDLVPALMHRARFKPWLPTVYTEPAISSDSDSDEADVIDYTGRRMPSGAAAPGSFVRRRRH